MKHWGMPDTSKTDKFSEKFQTAFDPPHFRKIILQIFSEIHDRSIVYNGKNPMTGSRMRRPHGQLLKWKQFQNPFTPTRKCAQRMKSQTMNHCNTMMQVYKCSALARSLVQFPARPSYSQPGFDLFLPATWIFLERDQDLCFPQACTRAMQRCVYENSH